MQKRLFEWNVHQEAPFDLTGLKEVEIYKFYTALGANLVVN
ncbi:MAG: hypothetical protein OXE92_05475 [Bacteroidetes bacterium]|nr:hypothetical protein [Bacteroidota bacterium]MCY4205160.1 hypothetical protein [Bacteroidota bacterium]